MAANLGSGLAQVFLQDSGLRFDAQGVDVLHYDHSAQLLLAVRRDSVVAYSTSDLSTSPQVPSCST